MCVKGTFLQILSHMHWNTYLMHGFVWEGGKKVFCLRTHHALWHDLVISNLLIQFITMNHYNDVITSHVSYKIDSSVYLKQMH